jgi:hypothetical protein
MGQAVINAIYKQFSKISDRVKANPNMDLETMRFLLEELHVLTTEPAGVTYEEVDAGGVPGIFVKPVEAAADRVIVYTHGGGCVTNSASSHRKLAGHIAKAVGVHALVLDYRLAPEHPFPAQLEDAVAAHRWLRHQGYKAEHTLSDHGREVAGSGRLDRERGGVAASAAGAVDDSRMPSARRATRPMGLNQRTPEPIGCSSRLKP